MKPFWWWTDEQIAYYNELGEFFKSVAKEEGRTRYTREFPFHIFEEVGKKGYLGAAIPKEYGGLGLGCTGSCMLAEQAHFISPGLGRIIVGDMNGGLRQIVEKGTEEQKKKFLPGIAAGETGAVVITEVSAGTDAAGIALVAEKKGSKYILNGRKRFIVGAGVADRFFIYARTSNDPEMIKKHKHLTAFIVKASEVKGITTEKINDILAFENVQNGSLIFDNVEIDEADRIGEEGEGFKIMMQGLNFERTNIAATTIGWHRAMLNYIVPYSERRIQFGKPTIDQKPNQDKITHILENLIFLRDAVYVTAKKWDLEENIIIDASVIKARAAAIALESAKDATQVMGGDGINTFYPIKNLYEVAKTEHIAGGTVEACELTIYRQIFKQMQEDIVWPRRVIDEVVGAPVPDYSPVEKKVPCDKKNMLDVLAENYRVNQGLDMTIADIAAYVDGSDEDIIKTIDELVADGDAVAHKNRKTGATDMARASYPGLSKAHPNEYYQWWQPFIDADPRRH
ncbi:MAG: acyl-CoA dehydrogenase family protein [Anaerovoracaceae bacterium]|jgi:alkylation response protein AidB-like acyl-CoA dehydrogenase|nr:acyl-CoA/acyl-ACP dehydrogenase [Bacillota bacterium]MDY2670865.1 acyl-CoA dehydrogenase family protein [Anaerovoracaceae bacterium]